MNDNNLDQVYCGVCNKEFKTLRQLSGHIPSHKIPLKTYYDQYMKSRGEGKCSTCQAPTAFLSIRNGYRVFCSVKCCNKNEIKVNQRKSTCQKKYGGNAPICSRAIKAKFQQTCVERYAVDNPNKLQSVRDKIKRTCNKKYGGNAPSCSNLTTTKSKQTCTTKYGVSNASKLKKTTQKREQTFLQKYGVENVGLHKQFQERAKQTRIKRYGSEHVMHNIEIRKRAFETCFKGKKYNLPSGKIIHLQGYEPEFLDYIFTNSVLNEDEIVYKRKGFKYILENKEKLHFPDFYIPKYNLYVEIKSDYVLRQEGGLTIQNLKEKSVTSMGHNYILVLNKDYNEIMDTYLSK